jgi:hypothetical protein
MNKTNTQKKWTFSASVTVSGYLEIEAESREEARKIAAEKNKLGINIEDLHDLNYY